MGNITNLTNNTNSGFWGCMAQPFIKESLIDFKNLYTCNFDFKNPKTYNSKPKLNSVHGLYSESKIAVDAIYKSALEQIKEIGYSNQEAKSMLDGNYGKKLAYEIKTCPEYQNLLLKYRDGYEGVYDVKAFKMEVIKILHSILKDKKLKLKKNEG